MLYAVAPPELSQEDDDRIAEIRRRYDPLARSIGPHVTLVFGVPDMPVDLFLDHVTRVAGASGPFRLRFSRALAVPEHVGARHHVFLIPDDGERVTRLHGALYGGPLSAHLRHDIPFVPHMTVGALADADEARSLAARLNEEALGIDATFDRIAVVARSGETLTCVGEVRL